MGGLAARLSDLAGDDLARIEPSAEHLARWNQTVDDSSRSSFEHRILIGIAVNRQRPEYGKVVDYQASVADGLGRSTRWVQATMSVSAAVDSAFQDGVVLPIEICDISWYGIPAAIVNVRNGRNPRRTRRRS